jgi:cell division protein ZipA
MDGLRLILLILGLVVVAGVWLFAREQGRRKVRHQARTAGREPVLGMGGKTPPDLDEERLGEELARMETVLREEGRPVPEPEPEPEPAPAEPVIISASRSRARKEPARPTTASTPAEFQQDKIVTLHIMAPAHSPFRGKDLLRAFALTGLEYGDMNIYHRFISADGQPRNAWVLANLVNPGTFDPEQMDGFSTPGVSLFLRLPGPVEGVRALDDMVETARRLASELNGELRDETRSALSRQRTEHLRSEVLEFERKLRVLHAKA